MFAVKHYYQYIKLGHCYWRLLCSLLTIPPTKQLILASGTQHIVTPIPKALFPLVQVPKSPCSGTPSWYILPFVIFTRQCHSNDQLTASLMQPQDSAAPRTEPLTVFLNKATPPNTYLL